MYKKGNERAGRILSAPEFAISAPRFLFRCDVACRRSLSRCQIASAVCTGRQKETIGLHGRPANSSFPNRERSPFKAFLRQMYGFFIFRSLRLPFVSGWHSWAACKCSPAQEFLFALFSAFGATICELNEDRRILALRRLGLSFGCKGTGK